MALAPQSSQQINKAYRPRVVPVSWNTGNFTPIKGPIFWYRVLSYFGLSQDSQQSIPPANGSAFLAVYYDGDTPPPGTITPGVDDAGVPIPGPGYALAAAPGEAWTQLNFLVLGGGSGSGAFIEVCDNPSMPFPGTGAQTPPGRDFNGNIIGSPPPQMAPGQPVVQAGRSTYLAGAVDFAGNIQALRQGRVTRNVVTGSAVASGNTADLTVGDLTELTVTTNATGAVMGTTSVQMKDNTPQYVNLINSAAPAGGSGYAQLGAGMTGPTGTGQFPNHYAAGFGDTVRLVWTMGAATNFAYAIKGK